jgi:hypothetical protein
MDIHTRAGEVVSDDGIAEIGQTKQMVAVAEVYQSDVSKVRPGQQVRVTSDSIPGNCKERLSELVHRCDGKRLSTLTPVPTLTLELLKSMSHSMIPLAKKPLSSQICKSRWRSNCDWIHSTTSATNTAWLATTESGKKPSFGCLSRDCLCRCLMFMQLGFQAALYDSNTRLSRSLNRDMSRNRWQQL